MKIGNVEDLMFGVAMEHKIRHWKKMANSGYLPKRRKFARASKVIVKG